MATFERALYYELANAATITALVSTRIYPAGDVPQDTTSDYMTYQRVSSRRVRHQGGLGLVEARYQFDCWAVAGELKTANAIANAVVAKFDRYREDMGETGQTVTVRRAYVEDERDTIVNATAGGQRGPAGVQVDVVFHYVE